MKPFRIFKYVDTFGLPLVFIADALEKENVPLCLDWFVFDAVIAGWSFDHVNSVCRESLTERFGIDLGCDAANRLEIGMKINWGRYENES